MGFRIRLHSLSWLVLAPILGLALWGGIFVVVAHADAKRPAARSPELPPAGPFPDAVCNEEAAMDIYVGPDGTLWECVCETMPSGVPACDWYDQGPVKARRIRRAAKLHLHVRVLPRLVVIHYA